MVPRLVRIMGDVKKVGNLTLTLAEEILKDYMEERKESHRWIYEANGWEFKEEEHEATSEDIALLMSMFGQ